MLRGLRIFGVFCEGPRPGPLPQPLPLPLPRPLPLPLPLPRPDRAIAVCSAYAWYKLAFSHPHALGEQYCNRFVCTQVSKEEKLATPCTSNSDCVINEYYNRLCLAGRCRGCRNADECAPGGEMAGWYCTSGGSCTQHPEKEREGINYPGRPKDIPFPKIPPKNSAP